VNTSGTADTALKTRLPSVYSGAPPLGSLSAPRLLVRSRGSSPSGAGQTIWLSR